MRRYLVALLSGLLFTCATHAQTAGRLPFTSNFDRLSEWDGFNNATGAGISTSGCQQGSCLRMPLLGGTTNDNYADHYFGDHITVRDPKVTEVWLRLYSKFDSGVIWPDRSQKIALLNLGDTSTYQRYYQVYIYVRPNGQYAVDHSDIANWRFWGLFQNVGAAVAPRLGEWDKLLLYVRLNTAGQPNGVVKLWVNDELKVDYSNVNIRQSASSNHGINKLIVGSYSTNSASTTGGSGVQWVDSLALSPTNPDAIAPRAPSNLLVD